MFEGVDRLLRWTYITNLDFSLCPCIIWTINS